MIEPVWLHRDLVLALHDDILDATGGLSGVRDEGLLESALARPVHKFAYEGLSDLVVLAATYAVAISGNHPFVDGNKRAAFMALGLFLDDNGLSLTATPDDATEAMLTVASGTMDTEALADWLRTRVEPA